MKDNYTMNTHRRPYRRFLVERWEALDGEITLSVKPLYVPRHPLREAGLYFALMVALIIAAIDYNVLHASPFDRLDDAYRTVAAQVDRAVEDDPRAADGYRKIGFLFRRSVDKAGTPHWSVSGYVPTEPLK